MLGSLIRIIMDEEDGNVSKPYRYARKRTLRPTDESTCKFQNLIGMLGRALSFGAWLYIFKVSKPYRYARKAYLYNLCSLDILVSKPYRYARKNFILIQCLTRAVVSKPYRYARKSKKV